MANSQFDEAQGAVAALMQSTVGRRWLLKAGLAGAAVAAAGAEGLVGAVPARAVPAATGPKDRILFQFALGAAANLADLTVHVNGEAIPLTPHTAATRSKLRNQGSLFRKINTQSLTHFADLRLPRDLGLLMSVHATRADRTVIVAQHMYAPVQGIRQVALAAWKIDHSYRLLAGSPVRQQRLGLDPTTLTSWQEVADLDAIADTEQTAIAMTMLHPNVATKGQVEVPATKSLLGQTSEVTTLGGYIDTMQHNGEDFASLDTARDADGKPSVIKVGTVTTGFTSAKLNTTDTTFQANTSAAVTAGVLGVRNTSTLSTVINAPLDKLHDPKDTFTRHTSEGALPTTTPYQPPSGVGAGTVDVTVQHPSLLYGTITDTGSLSGSTLPLTLYNNFVRWVWVYVQYFDVAGNQLPVNPNGTPTYPDTSYAKSVGLLPQIFTILGVPIWNTNTITPNLTFPPTATSARLLYCGLGNQAVDGGWRQYFPAAAYPANRIAPTEEVKVASIITGVFTIGLTAFALLTDIDIALTWGEVNKLIDSNVSDVGELIDEILSNPPWLAAADTAAATMATGAATYEDVSANGSASNIWSVLLGLGSLVPKIIFNPASDTLVAEVAGVILSDEAAEKLIDAIPFIGEVVGIIEAAGDAVTLAEAIAETANSPWVIGNRISLSYAAQVTISKDPRAATWPATARSWRVDIMIDGSTALKSQTGTFNANGDSAADIVLTLNPPFGGAAITYSMVVLDGDGHQVGTGSTKLTNNDSGNLPTTVSFPIVELPAAVDSATVFQRHITTAYQGSAGYGWIASPTDSTTRANSPIQEVTGVAVSTRLGVAALVWKQNDKYWVRGVPTAEDAGSITLGGATRQGYARRPFVLLDALVGAQDIGNHVILEPDDTTDGYFARALSVNATTGALSWDPSSYLAYFPLPVDDAALCSSGWVVAIHTGNARIATVLPAGTATPPVASYTAGPGDETGLLRTPTAIAVTTQGVVLVLESGRSRLAAFDIMGNPVRYFGTSTPKSFRSPLPTGRTYLDLAVDGSNQIYVLSYGTASQANSYRIDVFTPTGAPLTSNSVGANVAKLAVDYWRSIFAVNYTPLLDTTTGQPHIDPAIGVAEPSLSRLDPAG